MSYQDLSVQPWGDTAAHVRYALPIIRTGK